MPFLSVTCTFGEAGPSGTLTTIGTLQRQFRAHAHSAKTKMSEFPEKLSRGALEFGQTGSRAADFSDSHMCSGTSTADVDRVRPRESALFRWMF